VRLLRLRIHDFRGVDEREVTFLRDGVTVLVGPNEVGKSSMAEALDLLFAVQDSSAKAEVRAVKPVDRDAGPEVEADIETGPFAFTYRKRYLKGAETVLRITRPRPEQLTGRQAHERVEQILAETMDAALWSALRIKQGEGVGQASLAEAASLGQALDRAAGTVPEGQAETSLFDRARAEHDQYWTPTGRAKGDWPLRESVAQQQSTLDGIEAQLRAVAADVERAADLAEEHDRLVEAKGPEEARASELEARWRHIEEQVRDVEKLEEAEKAARLVAERAAGERRDRTAAIEELARAAAERDRQRAAAEAAAPSLASARERAARAAGALTDVRLAREAADARAKTARSDVDFLRARDQLAELTERRAALLAAQASLADAEAAARANLVDDEALMAIRTADGAARVARSLLEQARPTVAVTALRDVAVLVGGAPLPLPAGETARRSVEGRLSVELPDTLRVEVSAGRPDASLAAEAADAERALRVACELVGVADLAAAEGASAARRDARAVWAEQKRRIVELLAGEEPDRLDARVAMAERRTKGYLDARPAGPPMPADEDAAAAAAEVAETVAEAARTAESAAEREDRAAREHLTVREVAANEAAVRADLAERDVNARAAALEAARAAAPDAALDDTLAKTAAEHAAAVTATAAARAALESEGPDAARALLDNARLVVDEIAGRLRDLEIAQAEVRARLRDHGEDGLAERRDDAVTARDAAAAELDRWMRRANARKALYEALKGARDAAHLAYVGPLRDTLTSLGRVVFGPSLAVEVGEDLRVRNRTLDGRTVPFESLSVGAKEQFGVLMRLAGAMLVAPDGGVPLLLDDTLGFSDPRRLEAMGAVLALAGASCQVIVLTCYPERYRHVGGARTVALS
jgi:AAA ATPase domain